MLHLYVEQLFVLFSFTHWSHTSHNQSFAAVSQQQITCFTINQRERERESKKNWVMNENLNREYIWVIFFEIYFFGSFYGKHCIRSHFNYDLKEKSKDVRKRSRHSPGNTVIPSITFYVVYSFYSNFSITIIVIHAIEYYWKEVKEYGNKFYLIKSVSVSFIYYYILLYL